MEAKKISPAQLEMLFAFTRKHFVEYYDLQAELADHLAHAIEGRWQQQPGLSFDEALGMEFKKFGIFGFSDIVEQRQNALFKRYYRLVWQEFRMAFSFKLAVLMAAAMFGIYSAVMALPWLYAVFMLLFFGMSSYKLWKLKSQYRRKLTESGKKWLFEEIIFSCGGFGVMMTLPIQLLQHARHDSIAPWFAALLAVLLVLLFVYDYVVLFRMPARAEMYLQKVYPEYAMENLA